MNMYCKCPVRYLDVSANFEIAIQRPIHYVGHYIRSRFSGCIIMGLRRNWDGHDIRKIVGNRAYLGDTMVSIISAFTAFSLPPRGGIS